MMNPSTDMIADLGGDPEHSNRAFEPGTCEWASSPGAPDRREERTTTSVRLPAGPDDRPEDRSQRRHSDRRKANPLTRALRSHQLWLTITYLGLLVLMARGIAS
jgi:hypothetical protein